MTAEDRRAGVALRGVLTVGGRLTPWECGEGGGGLGGTCEAGPDHRERRCDLRIALAPLGGIAIAEGEGLLQDTERLRAPGTRQRQRHCIARFCAAAMAQGRQGVRVALPRDHGVAEARPGVPGAIAERLRPREVHLQERLLQVEDLGSAMRQAWGTMAEQRAQRHEVGFRPKGGRQ